MGTPASVACDPQGQAPAAQTRKRASANIFKGVGLGQLQHLFRSRGDERAEERARLVWEAAGDRRVAQALRQLRPRHRAQGGTRGQALQPFGYPRPEDCSTPAADPGSSMGLEGPSRARQPPRQEERSKEQAEEEGGLGPQAIYTSSGSEGQLELGQAVQVKGRSSSRALRGAALTANTNLGPRLEPDRTSRQPSPSGLAGGSVEGSCRHSAPEMASWGPKPPTHGEPLQQVWPLAKQNTGH